MKKRCTLCQQVKVVRKVKLEGLRPFYFCRLCWPVIQEGIDMLMKTYGFDEDPATVTMCAMALRYGKEGRNPDLWKRWKESVCA